MIKPIAIVLIISGIVASSRVPAQDLQAIASRCSQIAETVYFRQAQNELMMRGGCLAYCAHSVTGIQRYYDLYRENERNAKSLCSVGAGPDCNTINVASCKYR